MYPSGGQAGFLVGSIQDLYGNRVGIILQGNSDSAFRGCKKSLVFLEVFEMPEAALYREPNKRS